MHIDVPPGEYELWRGTPTRYRVMTWPEVKAIPGELVGLGLAWLVWQIEWFHIHPLLIAAFAGLILYRMPIRPLFRWWLLATTEYLLTDKQIVTTTRPLGFRRIRHSPLRSLREPELQDESDDGFGTIVSRTAVCLPGCSPAGSSCRRCAGSPTRVPCWRRSRRGSTDRLRELCGELRGSLAVQPRERHQTVGQHQQ